MRIPSDLDAVRVCLEPYATDRVFDQENGSVWSEHLMRESHISVLLCIAWAPAPDFSAQTCQIP